MKRSHKIIFGITSVFVAVALLFVAFFFWFITPPKMEEETISNGQYTIKTEIFEDGDMDFLTFYIEDPNGEVVFDCEESWRCWDFKGIKFIADTNDIYVDSADVGATIYRYDLSKNNEPIWIPGDSNW